MKVIVEYWDMFVKELVILKDGEEYLGDCEHYKEFDSVKDAKEFCIFSVNRLISDARNHKKEIQNWKIRRKK